MQILPGYQSFLVMFALARPYTSIFETLKHTISLEGVSQFFSSIYTNHTGYEKLAMWQIWGDGLSTGHMYMHPRDA